MKVTIIFILIFISIGSCIGQSQEAKNKARISCENIDSLMVRFYVQGYSYSEFKGTVVKQYHSGVLVDSFCVFPEKIDDEYSRRDSTNLKFWGDFGFRYLHTKDTYLFCVPNYTPHTLSNFKTTIRTGGYYCYLCEILNYNLDGDTKKGYEIAIIKESTQTGY